MAVFLWILALAVATVYFNTRKKFKLPLPPGPPADPIIGHLRYMPSESPEDKIAELSKIYGDVMHLRIFHRNTIVLNSVEAAYDLLDKRSANYSDRPNFTLYELMGLFPASGLLQYGERFRKHRRLLQQFLSRPKVGQFSQIQTQGARRLAVNLLEQSNDREAILRRYSASTVVQVAYGHQILSDDDPYLKMAEESAFALTHCGSPGGTPVDLFPILQYFPSWFPGAYFTQKAREFSPAIRNLFEYPFSEVQREMAEGRAKPSFVSYHLERLHGEHRETDEEFDDIRGAAGSIYAAGADTTWSTLSTFMLAMTLHPECQVSAQLEIDELLGGSRLPVASDRKSLPYLECILLECYRWLSAAPLGIPHRALADDVYKGMLIPKGSTVMVNTRGISMDDSVYHDPHSFKPSRYLSKSQGGQGEPHPVAHFGFGRRICIGRYLADTTLWIAMATILTLCNVKKAIGPDGKEITPVLGIQSGLTSHPKPYQCVVELRDQRAAKLVDEIKVESMGE